MNAPPIPTMFDGEAFRPLPNFLRIAREHYGLGEVAPMIRHEERSRRSHDHYFASVGEAWKNLPEHLAARHPTAEHLRKFALVQTGHYDATVYPCQFKTEARRLQAALAANDDFAAIIIDGKTVTKLTAKSQSLQAMGKTAFQKSKTDVLDYLAALIGVETEQLSSAGQRLGGAKNPAQLAA